MDNSEEASKESGIPDASASPINYSYDNPEGITHWAFTFQSQGRWREAADLWLTAAGLTVDDPAMSARCQKNGIDCLSKAEESEPENHYNALDNMLPKEISFGELVPAALEGVHGLRTPTASIHPELEPQTTSVFSDPAQASVRVNDVPERTHPDSAYLGQYKLMRKLGQGGMGAVYLAIDTLAQRAVALKVLPRRQAENPQFTERFKREVKALGRVNHPNIVAAFAVGEDRGYQYYVMEFFEGETLADRLTKEKTLGWRHALEIVLQVAEGLSHAHLNGIVHRDIKPANIYLAEGSVAKILDLGLAINRFDSADPSITGTGVALGTPHYMSPEQIRGENDVDGRSDIYSLGCTFYHMLTGRPPFEGSTIAVVLTRHLMAQVPNPRDSRPEIPESVVHVLERMTAKSRQDRYFDCRELCEDLELVKTRRKPKTPRVRGNLSTVALPNVRAQELLALASPKRGDSGASTHDVTIPHETVLQKNGSSQSEPETPWAKVWKVLWAPFSAQQPIVTRTSADIQAAAEEELRLIADQLSHDNALEKLNVIRGAIDDFLNRYSAQPAASRARNLISICAILEKGKTGHDGKEV